MFRLISLAVVMLTFKSSVLCSAATAVLESMFDVVLKFEIMIFGFIFLL